MAEQIVTLQPGESTQIYFEVTPLEAKTYQVMVDGLSGSFKVKTVPIDYNATIVIELYDSADTLLPSVDNQIILTPGERYTVKAIISQSSTQGDLPIRVKLNIGITAMAGVVLIPHEVKKYCFNELETKTFSWTFTVPPDAAGAGGIIVWVEVPDEGGYIAKVSENILIEGATATLAGRVVDADTGQPLSGVKVTLQVDGAEFGIVYTGEDGLYRFDEIPAPSTIILSCSLAGYESYVSEPLEFGWSGGGVAVALVPAVPESLVVSFVSPKNSSTFSWSMRLLDVAEHKWYASPIRNMGETYAFKPTSSTYILLVQEAYRSGSSQTSKMYGPYLIQNGPVVGAVQWDSRAEKLGGVKATSLIGQSSSIVGTLKQIQWLPNDYIGELVVNVEQASGAGAYFIGTDIFVYCNYPFRFYAYPIPGGGGAIPVGTPLMATGKKVTFTANMEMGTYVYNWVSSKVTYVRDYPSSAYNFNYAYNPVTLQTRQPYWPYDYMPAARITGNVSSFKLVATVFEGTYPHKIVATTGPVEQWQFPYIGGLYTNIWAHPDPNRPFPATGENGDDKALAIDNWVRVANFRAW